MIRTVPWNELTRQVNRYVLRSARQRDTRKGTDVNIVVLYLIAGAIIAALVLILASNVLFTVLE